MALLFCGVEFLADPALDILRDLRSIVSNVDIDHPIFDRNRLNDHLLSFRPLKSFFIQRIQTIFDKIGPKLKKLDLHTEYFDVWIHLDLVRIYGTYPVTEESFDHLESVAQRNFIPLLLQVFADKSTEVSDHLRSLVHRVFDAL